MMNRVTLQACLDFLTDPDTLEKARILYEKATRDSDGGCIFDGYGIDARSGEMYLSGWDSMTADEHPVPLDPEHLLEGYESEDIRGIDPAL